MTRTSTSYYCTVKMTNGKVAPEDQATLDGIKMVVKLGNEAFGEFEPKKYVKLQARGPRLGNRRYNQSLPLKYAVTADVYVYNR